MTIGSLIRILLATGAVLALSQVVSAQSDDSGERPNIVIVLTDDLGYGDVSFLNPDSKVQTPHMDALASEGVWATDAHSPSTLCSPSRYAMLTGHYAWRNKRTRGGRLNPWAESAIDKDCITLPKFLRSNGYATALIGKWHLGFNWPWKGGEKPPASVLGGGTSKATCDLFDWTKPIEGGPLEAGFDYYFGDDVPNMPPYAFIENDRLTCEPVDVNGRLLQKQALRAGGYIHGMGPGERGWKIADVMPAITAKSVDYIKRHAKQESPFFLLFATTSPHTPIVPQEAFQNKSEAGYYGDYVIQTDDAVGQIVESLKAAGVYENTLLVVSSDNGPAPMMRDLIQSHEHNPSGKLRGMKRDLLEGGHRVPFIASWPKGGIAGGRRISATISLTDLYATIAGMIDAPLPRGAAEDSLNVLPSLLHDTAVRTELIYQAGALGLRQGNWALLNKRGIKPEPDWYIEEMQVEPLAQDVLLYDLKTDPGQKTNLADKYPERVQMLQNRIEELRESKSTR